MRCPRRLVLATTLAFVATPLACQPAGPPRATRRAAEPAVRNAPRRPAASDGRAAWESIARQLQAAKGKLPVDLVALLRRALPSVPPACRLQGKLQAFFTPTRLPHSNQPPPEHAVLVRQVPQGPLWEEPSEDLTLCSLGLAKGPAGLRLVAAPVTVEGCGQSKVEASWEERPRGRAVLMLTCERVLSPMEANRPERTTALEHAAHLQLQRGRFALLGHWKTRHETMNVPDRQMMTSSTLVMWTPPPNPAPGGLEVLGVVTEESTEGSRSACIKQTRCYRLGPAADRLVPLSAAEAARLAAAPGALGLYASCGKREESESACR